MTWTGTGSGVIKPAVLFLNDLLSLTKKKIWWNRYTFSSVTGESTGPELIYYVIKFQAKLKFDSANMFDLSYDPLIEHSVNIFFLQFCKFE